MGGCSYLLRSTAFRQLVAKGGTLGRSAAAYVSSRPARIRIAPTLCVDFLKASQSTTLHVWSVRVDSSDRCEEKLQRGLTPEATRRECWDGNVTQHYQRPHRGVQSWQGSSLTQKYHLLQWHSSSLSVLRGQTPSKDNDSDKILEKLQQKLDQYSPQAELLIIVLMSEVYKACKLLLVMWKCLQIKEDFCRYLQSFLRLLNSAAFTLIFHVQAANHSSKSNYT